MKVSMEYIIEELYSCPNCNFIYPVYRAKNKKKVKRHKKSLYCPWCEQKRNFVKI